MNVRQTWLSRALLAGLAGMTMASLALADDDKRDQELARKALLEGRIRSLSEITEMLKPQLPGTTILGVELEVDKGHFVYEFDIVDQAGKLKEVDVDAASGAILKIEDDD